MIVAISIVAALAWIAPSGSAGACSCEEQYPTVADAVGRADIAFIGRLDSTTTLDPPIEESNYYDVRYELIVEEAVKGVEAGDRVVMFGDVNGGSTCGTSELTPGRDLYAILSSEYEGRFVADSTPPCSPAPSVDELRAVDLNLPETSAGPVSVVVVGRVGEAELITYAADGQPVAYGNLPRSFGRPAVCPGSERLVQLERDDAGVTELVVRDLQNLEVVDGVELGDADVDPADGRELRDFVVDGAVLECRSADGNDVVGLLPWESTGAGQTSVVRFDGTVDSVDVSLHGRASRAQHDPAGDDVVGVREGEFVRIDSADGTETVVADLLVEPAEAGYDAVFVAADGAGGWWVGLGDGGYELASTLRVLVHLDSTDAFERWPVVPPVESVYSADLDGGRLVVDGFSLALPALGSSADGAVVAPEVTESYGPPWTLADGRNVGIVTDDGSSSVELIDADGDRTTLQHLFQARHVVAVPDGPTVDVAAVDRTLSVPAVASPWITSSELTEFDSTTTTNDSIPTPPPAAESQRASGDDGRTQESATTVVESGSSGSEGKWWAIAICLAVVGVAGAVMLTRASRQRRLVFDRKAG